MPDQDSRSEDVDDAFLVEFRHPEGIDADDVVLLPPPSLTLARFSELPEAPMKLRRTPVSFWKSATSAGMMRPPQVNALTGPSRAALAGVMSARRRR